MGESKKRINSMYSYGVCSSYTEYRPFKKSAVADLKMSGISNADDGLVQAIADNFDADISSQNGRQSTHTHLPSFSLSTPRPSQRVNKYTTQESEESPMIPQRFLMMLISTNA